MTPYYFKPMMALYGRFVAAPTDWLMSTEGRRLIAKAIRLCRNHYGRAEGRRFRDALLYVGCLYPHATLTTGILGAFGNAAGVGIGASGDVT